MARRISRMTIVLSVGLLVALGISVLTRRNAPVLILFVVIGVTFVFGIGREWFKVTNPFGSKARTGLQILKDVVGSYPYVVAMAVMVIFTYFSFMMLTGHTISPQVSRAMGKVVAFGVTSIFFGGLFMYVLGLVVSLIRGRKKTRIHTANSATATQHVVGPERGQRPSQHD